MRKKRTFRRLALPDHASLRYGLRMTFTMATIAAMKNATMQPTMRISIGPGTNAMRVSMPMTIANGN